MTQPLVVFVHGWSVQHTRTYGGLPARLQQAAEADGLPIDVAHLYLGEYISFRDEVRVEDIAHAFDAALRAVLKASGRQRAVCITHSTGGPVVREWLARRRTETDTARCPISHLVMLAPANFGSALAQLGKARVGRLKAAFTGVEPGQRVLDWLELGSAEAWRRNHDHIHQLDARAQAPWSFVLCGDAIDRKLYDHVNPYTGETGSDGVVRLAAANLNASHLVIRQPPVPSGISMAAARQRLQTLSMVSTTRAAPTAFKILPGLAHSGTRIGIMGSVAARGDHPTVDAVMRCLRVRDARSYAALTRAFDAENARHQAEANRLEVERVPVLPDRHHIHDPCAQLMLRIRDDHGAVVDDIDVLLTRPGTRGADRMPRGFLVDRQANRCGSGVLTFYLNHAVLAGAGPVVDTGGTLIRPALAPFGPYGLTLSPRHPDDAVTYCPATLSPDSGNLLPYLRPNETTLVDIVLTRVVREGVFRLRRSLKPRAFKADRPGGVA